MCGDYVRFYVNVKEVQEEENVDNYDDNGNTEVTMTRERRNRNMAVIRLVRTMKWRMTMTILMMLMTKIHNYKLGLVYTRMKVHYFDDKLIFFVLSFDYKYLQWDQIIFY
jgi:hypothetical protein